MFKKLLNVGKLTSAESKDNRKAQDFSKFTCLGYSSSLSLLASGSPNGQLCVFGGPTVEFTCNLPPSPDNGIRLIKFVDCRSDGLVQVKLVVLTNTSGLHLFELGAADEALEFTKLTHVGTIDFFESKIDLTTFEICADNNSFLAGTESGDLYHIQLSQFKAITENFEDVSQEVHEPIELDAPEQRGAVVSIKKHPFSDERVGVTFIDDLVVIYNTVERAVEKYFTSRDGAMSYLFNLFRDKNQFDLLLSKNIEKTPELRIALFKYVKRNPDLYSLVILNISLLREIAESLEASASRRLCNLDPSINFKSDTLSNDLNVSLTELVDASDCYAKADCHKKSKNCEKLAKLVALQLHLLDRENCILNLSPCDMADKIVNLESFYEAYIISEAYDCHMYWRQALFNNVVLKNDIMYLNDYCREFKLSSNMIEELVLLYKQYINNHQLSRETSSRLAKAIKIILSRLSNIKIRYKVYTQLNFDDAKEELLSNPVTKAILAD